MSNWSNWDEKVRRPEGDIDDKELEDLEEMFEELLVRTDESAVGVGVYVMRDADGDLEIVVDDPGAQVPDADESVYALLEEGMPLDYAASEALHELADVLRPDYHAVRISRGSRHLDGSWGDRLYYTCPYGHESGPVDIYECQHCGPAIDIPEGEIGPACRECGCRRPLNPDDEDAPACHTVDGPYDTSCPGDW